MTTSWIICDPRTGEAVFETWQASVAAKAKMAVPIMDYLQALNRRIKEGEVK